MDCTFANTWLKSSLCLWKTDEEKLAAFRGGGAYCGFLGAIGRNPKGFSWKRDEDSVEDPCLRPASKQGCGRGQLYRSSAVPPFLRQQISKPFNMQLQVSLAIRVIVWRSAVHRSGAQGSGWNFCKLRKCHSPARLGESAVGCLVISPGATRR